MTATLLDELLDWLRIQSISSGEGDPSQLRRAAEWVVERVRAAGGEAEIVETQRFPLAVGELRAAREDAPTVLIYGHYDVQAPDPLEEWHTPPFAPAVRDGRIVARGAADDKGNFLPLLHVACELAARGELGVHVRVLVEGEEEAGGESALEWLRADERGADCALVFDSGMVDAATPAITVGVRGLIGVELGVRTAVRDLHSGLYGGAALNAVHALQRMLAAILPGPDGRLPEPLLAGVRAPSERERAGWSSLPDGAAELEHVGARPADAGAATNFYARTTAEPSLDVHGIHGGEAGQIRTIIPAAARAKLTMRLAAGQSSVEMGAALERLLRDAAPSGADVTVTVHGRAEPAWFDPEAPALRLAAGAIERACGCPPALVRSGGTIPILAVMAQRNIPCVLSGFTLPEDGIHAPNESFRLESLRLGERSARELYQALAALPVQGA